MEDPAISDYGDSYPLYPVAVGPALLNHFLNAEFHVVHWASKILQLYKLNQLADRRSTSAQSQIIGSIRRDRERKVRTWQSGQTQPSPTGVGDSPELKPPWRPADRILPQEAQAKPRARQRAWDNPTIRIPAEEGCPDCQAVQPYPRDERSDQAPSATRPQVRPQLHFVNPSETSRRVPRAMKAQAFRRSNGYSLRELPRHHNLNDPASAEVSRFPRGTAERTPRQARPRQASASRVVYFARGSSPEPRIQNALQS